MILRLRIVIFCMGFHVKWNLRNFIPSIANQKATMVAMAEENLVEGFVDWKGNPARKDKHGGIRAAMFSFVMMGFQNMAFVALAVNISTYLFGMAFTISEVSTTVTNMMGTTYMLALLGAFICDTYLSRLTTSVIAGCIGFLGYLLLTIQAHYPSLRPALGEKMSSGQAKILYTGLYLIAISVAGVYPAGTTLGADQFDERDPKERKLKSSYFNWLMFSICLGGVIGLSVIIWVESRKGFDKGFGISAGGVMAATLIVTSGLPFYRYKLHADSPLLRIMQVLVAAVRNRKLPLPENAEDLYEIYDKEAALKIEHFPHTNYLRCLDKAAIVQENKGERPNPWRQCTVTQVEETKILVRMVPIFLTTVLMSTCLAQLQTLSILQGHLMRLSLGKIKNIPPGFLPLLPLIFMVIITPVYDRLFVPFARRLTGIVTGITYFQRVSVGLVLSIISMTIAGLVEVKRKHEFNDHHKIISMFWLSFQYFVFGIADLFTFVGLMEFFYNQSPSGMKSLSTCFTWVSLSLGFFLSSVLVTIVNAATRNNTESRGWLAGLDFNKNHVELFYWLLAVLSTINFFIYLLCAKWYKYRPVAKDQDHNHNENQLKNSTVTTDEKGEEEKSTKSFNL